MGWYFLNKLEKDQQCKQMHTTLDNLLIPSTEIIQNDGHKKQSKDLDAQWMVFWAFRLQIICILIMYIALMIYALVRINSKFHIIDKLEVAISIFFILELDDWAYSLFIGQNLILSDSDFDIELHLSMVDHEKQIAKNRKALWCSLCLVVFSVTFIIAISAIFDDEITEISQSVASDNKEIHHEQ